MPSPMVSNLNVVPCNQSPHSPSSSNLTGSIVSYRSIHASNDTSHAQSNVHDWILWGVLISQSFSLALSQTSSRLTICWMFNCSVGRVIIADQEMNSLTDCFRRTPNGPHREIPKNLFNYFVWPPIQESNLPWKVTQYFFFPSSLPHQSLAFQGRPEVMFWLPPESRESTQKALSVSERFRWFIAWFNHL